MCSYPVVSRLPLLLGCLIGFFQGADSSLAGESPAAKVYGRQNEIAEKLQHTLTPHPRLLLTAEAERALVARLATDPALAQVEDFLRNEAEARLGDPVPERVLEGHRLLGLSQVAMKRLVILSYFWRRTGDPRFSDRVRADLKALIAFPDWNPSHFLDTAVLAYGVAIAYDWCYPALSPEERAAVREALKIKAFAPSRSDPWWVRTENNWNQVCHGGLGLAALAIADEEPAEAAWVLARAVESLPIAMHTYGPDGAYAEGPAYWGFGTTFNVYLLDALQTALGTDFGLSEIPGFLQTSDYLLHSNGPSGQYFNYSDSGPRDTPVPAVAWFAARTGRPELLASEWPWMQRRLDAPGGGTGGKYAPEQTVFLVWAARLATGGPALPGQLHWSGRGPTPVAYHRSGWNEEATWIAIKGGTPSTNHGHMDVGSFVVDALGVRWASDLGMQTYNNLEKTGIQLWNMAENSTRWNVFRLGAASHNVLTVDGRHQVLTGSAEIVRHGATRTVLDISSAYTGQLAAARRGVALLPDRSVLIQDELKGGDGPRSTVRWAMLTAAKVTLSGGAQATLEREGKTLALSVLEPAGVTLETYSTEPPASYDAPNPGTVMVGFRVPIAAGASSTFRVRLVPGDGPVSGELPPASLADW